MRWFFVFMLALLMAMLITGSGLGFEEPPTRDVLRLHILANSDQPLDQEVKLAVRDAILASLGSELAKAASAYEAYWQIENQLERVAQVAEGELKRQGMKPEVAVRLGPADFPTRTYDGRVFPAGRYQALQVFIGKGLGANWWCVLFPPLCLVEGTVATTKEDSASEIKAQAPQLRFKLWELLKGKD
ncbi:MAG: stage II sporulation protein R [bacterium]